jgi:hypothetical protein
MPSLKRLVSVVAVTLFAILGMAQTAGADIVADPPGSAVNGAPPSTPPAADATGGASQQAGPLLPPAPPVRHEDPKPDGGAPAWLWITLALLTGAGVGVAVLLWRGSRAPAGAELPPESTAELMAVGRH